MISRITNIYSSNKGLTKNFLSLGALQLTNFILPLLLTPFLIKILGIYNFGLLSLSQAVVSFFIIFTDYGFNLTATKEVALNKGNHSFIQKLYSQVLSTKVVLTLIGFFVLYLGVVITSNKPINKELYFYSYTMVVGQVLMPTWLFQGKEDMKYITYFSIASKMLAALIIVLIIRSPEQFIFINLIYGLSTVLAGMYSIWFIHTKYKITFVFAPLKDIRKHIVNGWNIFISNFTVNIYMASNIIILGLFANKQVIGYYSIAEKVMNAVRQILGVFFQVVYPQICIIAKESKRTIYTFLKKVYFPFLLLIFILCTLIFIFSEPIVLYFAKEENLQIELLLRMLSFVPFIVALNIPVNQLLLAYNFHKTYSYVLIIGSCINLVVNSLLSYYYAAFGTAVAVIVTELFITSGLYLLLGKRNPLLYILPNSNKYSSLTQ